MRKIFLSLLLVTLMAATFVNAGSAIAIAHTILYTPCIASDGTYRLTVQAIIKDAPSLDLQYQINGGDWIDIGTVTDGWTTTHTGLPGGTVVNYQFVEDEVWYGILLEGDQYPACVETKVGAQPLFKMFLLTKADTCCIVISELHPSVERQKAICFPGLGWVADWTPCAGWVYDDDTWECDIYGYGRLPLKELLPIYERHAAQVKQALGGE